MLLKVACMFIIWHMSCVLKFKPCGPITVILRASNFGLEFSKFNFKQGNSFQIIL